MLDRIVARAASLATGTEPALVFATLGRHPRLLRAWLPFAGTLLFRGELLRVDTELAILRTAWQCRCWDEWHQHVPLARRAGLTSAQIAAVSAGAPAAVWSDRERAVLRAVDDLHRDRRLSPGTGSALEAVLSDRQVVELCLLVGHYEMLAMVIESGRASSTSVPSASTERRAPRTPSPSPRSVRRGRGTAPRRR